MWLRLTALALSCAAWRASLERIIPGATIVAFAQKFASEGYATCATRILRFSVDPSYEVIVPQAVRDMDSKFGTTFVNTVWTCCKNNVSTAVQGWNNNLETAPGWFEPMARAAMALPLSVPTSAQRAPAAVHAAVATSVVVPVGEEDLQPQVKKKRQNEKDNTAPPLTELYNDDGGDGGSGGSSDSKELRPSEGLLSILSSHSMSKSGKHDPETQRLAPSADEFQDDRDEWMCQVCILRNSGSRDCCTVCEKPRGYGHIHGCTPMGDRGW